MNVNQVIDLIIDDQILFVRNKLLPPSLNTRTHTHACSLTTLPLVVKLHTVPFMTKNIHVCFTN